MVNKAALSKVIAAAVSAAAIIPIAVPAMAATQYDTSKQSWGEGVPTAPSMYKYLIMKRDARVPNVTFSFTISADGVTEKAATDTTLAVYKGNDSRKVTGQPVLQNNGTVTFSPNDSAYTTYQSLGNDLGGAVTGRTDKDMLSGNEGFGDTIDDTKQYAKKEMTIDFSGVKFSEPGVYRWKITESTTDTDSYDVKDENGKYLDVYVMHKEGTTDALVVSGYVLHDAESDVSTDGTHTPTATNTKDGGFVNEYLTQDLTFGKQVTGNQGSRDKYFEFTLELSGAAAGDIFNVDITDADGNIVANPNSATKKITSAVTNPTTLTANASGAVSQKFYLQADQSIVIRNLSKGISYTLTEDREEYVSTAASESTPVTYNRASGTLNEGDKNATDPTRGTIGTKNVVTGFKNAKDGTVPTSVIYNLYPGAVAVLFGGAGAVLVMKRKKRS